MHWKIGIDFRLPQCGKVQWPRAVFNLAALGPAATFRNNVSEWETSASLV